MSQVSPTIDVTEAVGRLEAAQEQGQVTAAAVENIRNWLTQPRYARYEAEVRSHIEQQQWQALDDAFWQVIPFGTGGRRGRMYPIGSNAINDRTIGESAQGLVNYVREQLGEGASLSCALAYDTRHKSRHFAELCARIMVAAGLKVYFLDDYRSTPELSFLVRYKQCSCGIMVTASHNPPSDNAVKVYWSTGGQVLPPHDKAIIDQVMTVETVEDDVDFEAAVADGRIVICTQEVDAAFTQAVLSQKFAGPRDVKIIYSPLHGVGESAVMPALTGDGFTQVEIFEPHRQPDGDFTNVPGHVSNPENPQVFDAMIQQAKETGADLVMATDPDCDRLGCGAPLTAGGEWKTFTGNQIGALLTEYVLSQRKAAGGLSPNAYVVKTLVTTEMVRRIAESYGVRCEGNLLVGFKHIGGTMDEAGPDGFLFGCEESHGYLVGQYARDKDGAVAAMLLAEAAAAAKAEGKTLHEKLDDLYWQHGLHAERLVNQKMEGSQGMQLMSALMARFRSDPPQSVAGMKVSAVRDYASGQVLLPRAQEKQPLDGPTGNMVILELLSEGETAGGDAEVITRNFVAVRPSGTEPKVKFYMFTSIAPELLADLEDAKSELETRLTSMASDLASFASQVEA